ncbi:hypothetical protein FRB99_006653 [Tulasnella sp. 403]|nr:hypothetical protein FRB99_006653 [Tulasnella sp. 403]
MASNSLNTPLDEGFPTPTGSTTPVQVPYPTSSSSQWQGSMSESSYFPPATSPQPRPPSPLQGTNWRANPNRFPRTVSSTSISNQRRQPHRSASIASSNINSRPAANEGGTFSGADEEPTSPSSEDDGEGISRRGRTRSVGPHSMHEALQAGEDTTPEGGPIEASFTEDDPVTVKDRQSLINVQHPFGLPIWKPALYQKSRTVTRNAETELHAQPSRTIESHYLPGNIFWTLVFGWWMALIFVIPAAFLFLIPRGGRQYARLVYGLAWYLFWPFGKYVQGDGPEEDEKDDDHHSEVTDVEYMGRMDSHISSSDSQASGGTIRGRSTFDAHEDALRPNRFGPSSSWEPIAEDPTVSLLRNGESSNMKSYGSLPPDVGPSFDTVADAKRHWLGRACFWLFLFALILPIMLVVCLICWALVITIPMAKLQWALIKHLFWRHNSIQFCSPPLEVVVAQPKRPANGEHVEGMPTAQASFTVKTAPRLEAGQSAPSGSPRSTVLLCTYRAVGLQYYKYTIGGVNIMFVNLMPVVFFSILDGFFLLPYVDKRLEDGEYVPPILLALASRSLIFLLSLASVIPLSYFIGMAVASISAQSSIGMGAVINATFGSIIEIILYSIALTQGKGLLVEGSIVGSLLAGVGLMPGVSMISGAMRKKEQKFNAKSAGVTSTMLIMAIIGTLTPTLFYQVYGNFQLVCDKCPPDFGGAGHSRRPRRPDHPWQCGQCYYEHPNPVEDPFYQDTVKELMYFCAGILLLSYLIGLWFSLRTHATQIWQNPQQLMNPLEIPHLPGGAPIAGSTVAGTGRMSVYNRIVASQLAQSIPQQTNKLLRKASILTNASVRGGADHSPEAQHMSPRSGPGETYMGPGPSTTSKGPPSPTLRRITYSAGGSQSAPVPHSPTRPHASSTATYAPILETVSTATKDPTLPNLPLPSNMTTDEFTRAVAVTVSALRQREVGGAPTAAEHAEGGHGHEAPSWSRFTSATILLSCTALYAAIAEVLIDVVDVVLQGSGIDEKFLGVTLFALVPNVTEFMNAISFALNGNIALSMEIGSAYALQVCLLQIPAMVAFSAWYDPRHIGSIAGTFTLIFPRWDVIAIILSIFLLTYTYIEAKSNYHRGSTLVLSYIVLMAGFYYAPSKLESETSIPAGNSFSAADRSEFTFFQLVQVYLRSLFTR